MKLSLLENRIFVPIFVSRSNRSNIQSHWGLNALNVRCRMLF